MTKWVFIYIRCETKMSNLRILQIFFELFLCVVRIKMSGCTKTVKFFLSNKFFVNVLLMGCETNSVCNLTPTPHCMTNSCETNSIPVGTSPRMTMVRNKVFRWTKFQKVWTQKKGNLTGLPFQSIHNQPYGVGTKWSN